MSSLTQDADSARICGNVEHSDNGMQEDHDGKSDQPPLYNPLRKPDASATMPYRSEIGTPFSWRFQIELADLFARHRTNLKVYDDLISLVKNHSSEHKLKFLPTSLMNRESFLKKLETCLDSTYLKPRDVTVNLTKGTMATFTVFDQQAMILLLLFDKSLMRSENMVEGCNLLTGKVDRTPTHIGETHTKDAWEEARAYFCGDNPNNMPIGLVLFGDKSHLDLHGLFSTTPLSFTLSWFNQKARDHPKFWRPIACLPNLSHGHQKVKAHDSLADKLRCLEAALASLVKISENGGIASVARGKFVVMKVWIHIIVGDCQGNSCWAGHYMGGKQAPWRDCVDPQERMSDPNPTCTLVTPNMVELARIRKAIPSTRKLGVKELWKMWKHDINNAFMQRGKGRTFV